MVGMIDKEGLPALPVLLLGADHLTVATAIHRRPSESKMRPAPTRCRLARSLHWGMRHRNGRAVPGSGAEGRVPEMAH
jgi:hypothetical protein